MNATLTLVLCLVSSPDRCEVRDLQVDAQACFYGGANLVEANTPEGWRVARARCVPAHRGNLEGAGTPPTGRPPARPEPGRSADG